MVRQFPPPMTQQRAVWNENRPISQNQFLDNDSVNQPQSLSNGHSDSHLHINTALKERCGIEDFAIVFINPNGRAQTHTSPSLRDLDGPMFNPHIDNILQRVAQATPRNSNYPSVYSRNDNVPSSTNDESHYGRRQSTSTSSSDGYRFGPRQLQQENAMMESGSTAQGRKRHRGQQFAARYGHNVPSSSQVTTQSKPLLLNDKLAVSEFLAQRFRDLQQSGCKVCAKAFVKKIEPKKQTNHPYTGKEARAPKWWPLPDKKGLGVRHREPDHLLKPERVKLLVHIILLVAQPAAEKQDSMRSVDVRALEEHTQEAMQQWFSDREHLDNAKKQPYLREIFKVARNYERFLNGELDETASVMVAHGDGISELDDEIDEGQQYEEDEETTQEYTPTSSMASPRETIVSPLHSQPNLLQEPRTDNPSYYHLPVRSYQQLPTPTEDSHYQDPANSFRSSQLSNIYPTSGSNMFSPRPSQWTNQPPLSVSLPTSTHFSATTGAISPFPTQWQNPAPSQILTYGNSYTTSQPQASSSVLPPPTQMLQQHGSSSYNNHIYMPPPPQEHMRTCVLPGPSQSILPGSHHSFSHNNQGQYTDYMEEKIGDQFNAGQDISGR